jgi:hypothetical protein
LNNAEKAPVDLARERKETEIETVLQNAIREAPVAAGR